MAEDEVVGWLSNARSIVYHSDMEHAMAGSTASPVPVTSTEVIKLAFSRCRRCFGPKAAPVPEYVSATAAALRTMFVVDGTEDEVNQMARDFLDALAESGFRVTRIPKRKEPAPDPAALFDLGAGGGITPYPIEEPLDFSGVDDEVDAAEPQQCDYFNGYARRCDYHDGHAGPHSFDITTPQQEGTTA